jgi:hypothetical protein
MHCESCGLEAPTSSVQLYQNIGMLVMRRYQSVGGNLCRPCIDSYFWRFTLVTSVLGWWGLLSFLLTPFLIANNLFQFLKSRGLSTVTLGSGGLPIYAATPSSAQVACPHCQSYQTQVVELDGVIILSAIGSVLLLLWGSWMVFDATQGGTASGNLWLGIIEIGIAVFAALSFWMVMNNRMWWCSQCDRAWSPRRS